MRARRRLVEGRQDQRAIERLARAVVEVFRREALVKAKELMGRPEEIRDLLGVLGRAVSLDDFGASSAFSGVMVAWRWPEGRKVGSFNKEQLLVTLRPNYRLLMELEQGIQQGNQVLVSDRLRQILDMAEDVLIHELTHAWEYQASGGRSWGAGVSVWGQDEPGQMRAYLAVPSEVRARYAQAVAANRKFKILPMRTWMNRVIKAIEGWEELPEEMRRRVLRKLSVEYDDKEA